MAAKKKASAKKASAKKAVAKKKTSSAATKVNSTSKKAAPSMTTRNPANFHGFEPYQETDGEEYMNEPQTKHFMNILGAWKQELMEEVDRTVHHMQDEAANFPDPNDRATQESEFAMELRARDRERKLIKKIEESIRNLENEDYGFCEQCGIEIGIRRLEARPTASLCIDCKTLDEIREKHVSS
jgi:DnaK suppressor protein